MPEPALAFDPRETVAQIVARFPASARVFQAHRIDYCCRGEVTVAEALRGRPERPEDLFAELEAAARARASQADGSLPADLGVPALIARILDRHHAFLRRALPALEPLLQKIADVHGDHDPRLLEVLAAFLGLRASLEPHLEEEETVLFPLLMSRGADRARIARELGRMREEHLEVGRALDRIRDLTDDFATPEWGCATYRLAMAELDDFTTDVLRHVHLENHVLMPRFVGTAQGDGR
jgi:regulator of cell morphogenesis and NO signaling